MFKIMLIIGIVSSLLCLCAGFLIGYTINYNNIVEGINDALEKNNLGFCENPDIIGASIFNLLNGSIDKNGTDKFYRFSYND